MTIDDKIVYHRKRLGLTQKQLADYLGITVNAVQLLEWGKSKEPTLHTAVLLSDLFGCDVREFDKRYKKEGDQNHVIETVPTSAGSTE